MATDSVGQGVFVSAPPIPYDFTPHLRVQRPSVELYQEK